VQRLLSKFYSKLIFRRTKSCQRKRKQ